MRLRVVLVLVALGFLVSGCGTQKHPNYSGLQQVPGSQLATLKQELKESPIKPLELPTKLPFAVTQARLQMSVTDMRQRKQVSLFFSGGDHVLVLDVFPDSQNQALNPKNTVMRNAKATKLRDGTKAIYGNNGIASMLDWVQAGALYSLSSTNIESQPDLTEQQLIHVAQSFG